MAVNLPGVVDFGFQVLSMTGAVSEQNAERLVAVGGSGEEEVEEECCAAVGGGGEEEVERCDREDGGSVVVIERTVGRWECCCDREDGGGTSSGEKQGVVVPDTSGPHPLLKGVGSVGGGHAQAHKWSGNVSRS